jgi:hypothetical protein
MGRLNSQTVLAGTLANTLLIAAAAMAQAQTTTHPHEASPPWSVMHEKEFSIAVPSDWHKLEFPSFKTVLHLTGDGKGLPHLDETGSPLQTGMSIERFQNVRQTPEEGSAFMLRNLRADPNMEIIGEPKVESVQLSDGTHAVLQTTEFFRTDKHRRSYHMKLIAEDANKVGWVVVGWTVGGKESSMTEQKARHVQRLRAHLLSFCFDRARFTDAGVRAEYTARRNSVAPARVWISATAVVLLGTFAAWRYRRSRQVRHGPVNPR